MSSKGSKGRKRKVSAWQARVRRGALAGSLLVPGLAGAMNDAPNPAIPDQFRTDEYRALWALEAVHAADAYALGYTGKGVRVGVVDDGDVLDHPEFAGRTMPWEPSDPHGPQPFNVAGEHSMPVSGVLGASKDGRGMHGVAYGATIIPLLGYSETIGVQTPFAIYEVVDRGAAVINASYGPPAPTEYFEDRRNTRFKRQTMHTLHFQANKGTLEWFSEEADALRYAAAHDVVTVYAAGNDYREHMLASLNPTGMGLLPYIQPRNHGSGVYRIVDGEQDSEQDFYVPEDYPELDPADSRLQGLDFSDLEGTLIVAVATAADGRIASYSNACGVAWRWCMAAPGGDSPEAGQSWESAGTYSPQVGGGYSAKIVGTSFAAPMVAGGAALMREAFPYMTARQIIEVMLTSADRNGYLANREIYGRGMLDLGRAVRGPVEFGAEGFKPVFDVDTQGYNSWWRNDIGGAGGLTKRGAGLLLMTGDNAYTGPTTVKGGTLAVYGSNARSMHTIERDATLAGSGTVGSTEVSGTVAPGNPGSPLTVAGDYVQREQGVYVAGISADGMVSDRIQVQGSSRIENAALLVMGMNAKAVGREFTVLQADGGIQGDFAPIFNPYRFLNLMQGAAGDGRTRYRFTLNRNATSFADAAATANQRAAARALETADVGLAPHDATLMATRSDDLGQRFDRWSGESHASTLSALSTQSTQVRDGMLGRARAMGMAGVGGHSNGNGKAGAAGTTGTMHTAGAVGTAGMATAQPQSVVHDGTGKAFWAQYAGSRDRLSGNGNAAAADTTSSGLFVGTDMPWPGSARDGARLGLMAGFTSGDVKVDGRGSASKVDSYTLGTYGSSPLGKTGIAGSDGPARLRYGAAYTWHGVSARRDTAGLETAEGRYKAGTAQLFTEAGLPYTFGGTTIEPYAGLAYVDTRRRAFNESGNAGLHAAAAKQQLGYSTLGLRGGSGWDLKDGSRLALHGGVGWRHAYGNVTPSASMRFAQGDSFDVQGTPVARDALLLEAGASVASDRGMTLSLGYSGQLARNAQSHAVKANAAWRF